MRISTDRHDHYSRLTQEPVSEAVTLYECTTCYVSTRGLRKVGVKERWTCLQHFDSSWLYAVCLASSNLDWPTQDAGT
jgi:sulfur relay (sulfurtransferase) DsrF/TusC family protein